MIDRSICRDRVNGRGSCLWCKVKGERCIV